MKKRVMRKGKGSEWEKKDKGVVERKMKRIEKIDEIGRKEKEGELGEWEMMKIVREEDRIEEGKEKWKEENEIRGDENNNEIEKMKRKEEGVVKLMELIDSVRKKEENEVKKDRKENEEYKRSKKVEEEERKIERIDVKNKGNEEDREKKWEERDKKRKRNGRDDMVIVIFMMEVRNVYKSI